VRSGFLAARTLRGAEYFVWHIVVQTIFQLT
jgi:hypothetical protein